MASNNLFKSDLYKLHGIVQNSAIMWPKQVILATLRDFFSNDSYYRYVSDKFGFPNTPDHTDLPLDIGLNDKLSTRLFIGENYRKDAIFYPAILIKHGGARSVPISINRDTTKVNWNYRTFEDGYGNIKTFKYPDKFVFNGAWEGSIIIDIKTRSLRSRDELAELVAICFTQLTYENLRKVGVVVKPLQIGSPSEIDDRNDKIFQVSLTLDIRSEWQVEQPIGNVLEIINFAIEFGRTDVDAPVAQNLTINTYNSILEILEQLWLNQEIMTYISRQFNIFIIKR